MLGIRVNCVGRHLRLIVATRRLARVGVRFEAWRIARRYRDTDAMTRADHQARRPQVDLKLVDFLRL